MTVEKHVFNILHPGLSRYHHLSLVVPLAAALSPMLLVRLNVGNFAPHFKALVYGTIAAITSWVLMTYVPFLNTEFNAPGKSVLLGLLVAELMVFGASEKIPSIAQITFFLFMYTYGLSELSHPYYPL